MAEKEYIVVAPDGKEITIVGPEGASQQEVIAQAQKLYKPSQSPKYDLGAAAPVLTGAKQAIEQTLTTGAGSLPQRVVKGALVDPVLGTLQLAGSEGAGELAKKVEAATQQGRKERGSEGFDFAQLTGALANPQNYLIPLKSVALAEGSGIGARILNSLFGRSVTAGAVAGATQPVLDTDYAAEKLKQVLVGGVTGGGFAAAGMAAGKVKDVVSEMTKPFTDAGRDSLLYTKLKSIIPADVWDQVKDTLNVSAISDKTRQALGLPTAKQTAAEATANIPEATGLAAYQRAVSKTEGESAKFAALQADQEAARLASIRNVGKTSAELTAAEAEREASAKALYGTANEALLPGRERQLQTVKVGETSTVPLREVETGTQRMVEVGRNPLTNEPIMQPAMSIGGQPLYKQVVSGYKYDPQISNLMERPAIKAAFDDAATIAKNQGIDLFTTEGKLTGQGAHLVKLALDDAMTGPAATTALGKNAKGAIEASKGAYLNWVEKAVPAYKEARETFAAQSGPINRMKVGQALEDKLKTSIGDKERAGAFATAVNDSATLLKKATGQQRYKSLNEILTPEEMKNVDYVLESLVRKEMANTAAGKTNISVDMIGKEGHQLPQFLSATATVANSVLRKFRGDANVKITAKFSELLRNPAELAKFMEGVPAKDASAVSKALMYVLPPESRSALAARLGAVVPVQVYGQETKPSLRPSVFPQNQQPQRLFQPQSKAEAVNVIAKAAQQYGKPQLAGLLTGIAKVESDFNPNAKSKGSTAAGMFQFTKATQKDYGLTNPYDAAQSAGAAAAYIDKLLARYKGDKVKALAAYNQGPGVIDKGLNKAGREYAMKVLAATRNI